jgi:hypothetical protein
MPFNPSRAQRPDGSELTPAGTHGMVKGVAQSDSLCTRCDRGVPLAARTRRAGLSLGYASGPVHRRNPGQAANHVPTKVRTRGHSTLPAGSTWAWLRPG